MATHDGNLAKVRVDGNWTTVTRKRRVNDAWVPSGSGYTGWNGYGAGNWPDASWQPFHENSPFNRPVNVSPGNDVVHENSTAIISTVLGLSGNVNLPVGNLTAGRPAENDYGHPIYFAQADDPLFTLLSDPYKAYVTINNHQIRVPDAALPAGGGDGHMCIIQPDGWAYELWQVKSKPIGGGTLTFSLGGRIHMDEFGLGGKATASGFGLIAGAIRGPELQAGEINHALFCTVAVGSDNLDFGHGVQLSPIPSEQGTYVYPAQRGDAFTDEIANLPPMGARFWLDMTESEINALAVPAWKKTLLKALHNYGAYFGDTGGPGFSFMFESSATYTSFGYTDPFVDYAQAHPTEVTPYQGYYVFNVSNGVNWVNKLKVILPPPEASV
jgi:hypothetical protein